MSSGIFIFKKLANSAIPVYVVNKMATTLSTKCKVGLGSKLLVLRSAYKPLVNDMHESLAMELMKQLQIRCAVFIYSNSWVSVFTNMRRYESYLEFI